MKDSAILLKEYFKRKDLPKKDIPNILGNKEMRSEKLKNKGVDSGSQILNEGKI